MYCSNCGQEIPYGQTSCPNCNPANHQASAPTNGTYYNPPQSYNTYNQQSGSYTPPPQQNNYFTYSNNTNEYERQCETDINTANTLGIVSIVIGLLVSRLVGLILGIVGLSKLNNIPDWPKFASKKADAKRLNKIGIIIPIIIYAIAFVIAILGFCIFGFALSNFGCIFLK